ncbi:uncharacterized protein NECHADRAFT_88694 [Fusarium vanettenii 77-13-4]|uniref:Uncharacterized protein n=1 Tax=Fusarium vanettenii (strain ATCC MYA-4622 / CBS 123669 / FGSC 9596 / NRRL 45880 / 77-13-4) TaxID=660122 RepID=C7ZLJ1_FUSV7|nr:uncharacterized protein NECHADRAFT_88694 [Fusarium vanettenii 77-13-4]EEU35125.1 predicted protein [Fusarium vanettenii 77-13-4]
MTKRSSTPQAGRPGDPMRHWLFLEASVLSSMQMKPLCHVPDVASSWWWHHPGRYLRHWQLGVLAESQHRASHHAAQGIELRPQGYKEVAGEGLVSDILIYNIMVHAIQYCDAKGRLGRSNINLGHLLLCGSGHPHAGNTTRNPRDIPLTKFTAMSGENHLHRPVAGGQAFPVPGGHEAEEHIREEGFVDERGLIKDVHATKVRIARDELLHRARELMSNSMLVSVVQFVSRMSRFSPTRIWTRYWGAGGEESLPLTRAGLYKHTRPFVRRESHGQAHVRDPLGSLLLVEAKRVQRSTIFQSLHFTSINKSALELAEHSWIVEPRMRLFLCKNSPPAWMHEDFLGFKAPKQITASSSV